MSAPREMSAIGRVAAILLIAVACGVGQAQVASEPVPELPRLPDASGATIEIVDLEEAPPIAQEAILDLVLLGAYPVDAEMRAFPNQFLDQRTAAFMLVNLFSLHLVDQFPVPPDEAMAYLQAVTETVVQPDEFVTVGAMRDYVLAFADLSAEETAELALILTERYPALLAGNVDVPITRAGAALMVAIALEHLTRTEA